MANVNSLNVENASISSQDANKNMEKGVVVFVDGGQNELINLSRQFESISSIEKRHSLTELYQSNPVYQYYANNIAKTQMIASRESVNEQSETIISKDHNYLFSIFPVKEEKIESDLKISNVESVKTSEPDFESINNADLNSKEVESLEENIIQIPGKARLKFSPRIPNLRKRSWLSNFDPVSSNLSLHSKDANNKWNISNCQVILTRLPEEIAEIYFSKNKSRNCGDKPLMYLVPTVRASNKINGNLKGNIRSEIAFQSISSSSLVPRNSKGATGKVSVKKNKPPIKIKLGKKHLLKSIQDLKKKNKKKRKEKKRCSFCGKVKRSGDLLKHKAAVFNIITNLTEQINPDHSKSECDICGTKLCSGIALQLHKQQMHSSGNEKFNCFVCNQFFNSQPLLAFHLQMHYAPAPPPPPTASPPLPAPSPAPLAPAPPSPSASFEIPKEYKKYKCDFCPDYFLTKQALGSHRNVHIGTNYPYQCQTCFKKFSKRINLEAHAAVHSKEKVYDCTECSKKFRFKSSLSVHLLLHKSKQYKCKLCKMSFGSSSTLANHVNKVHHLTMAEKCPSCDKLFLDRHTLNSHWKLYHTSKRAENDSSINELPSDPPLPINGTNSSSEEDEEEDDEQGPFLIDCRQNVNQMDVIDESVVQEVESMLSRLLSSSLTSSGNDPYDLNWNKDHLRDDPMIIGRNLVDNGRLLEPLECPLCDAVALSEKSEISEHLLSFHRVNKKKLVNLLRY